MHCGSVKETTHGSIGHIGPFRGNKDKRNSVVDNDNIINHPDAITAIITWNALTITVGDYHRSHHSNVAAAC